MKTEIKMLEIINPYNDTIEELVCTIDHRFNKGKLEAVSITKIMSNAEIDLTNYLKEDLIEDLELEYVKEYT